MMSCIDFGRTFQVDGTMNINPPGWESARHLWLEYKSNWRKRWGIKSEVPVTAAPLRSCPMTWILFQGKALACSNRGNMIGLMFKRAHSGCWVRHGMWDGMCVWKEGSGKTKRKGRPARRL